MKSTQKKPITAFTVISTIVLLLLTVLFIFPFYWILTGAFKSQPDTIMIPPQWWPKTPTMENFQQLMVQNPALQWLWNSVFISLATMLLVCMTSSLAGYVLAKKRFYGQRILFLPLSQPWPFRNKLSWFHWYALSTLWESTILLQRLFYHWLDGHSGSS